MARPPQSSAQIAAAAQARTQGAAQGRALGSPLIKRSQMLADLLEKSQNPQQIAGYGDLGIRLLSQALLQTAKGRTDSAQAAEASNADLARRQRIAAAVGGNIQGTPQEVGSGRIGNPLAGLVDGARNLFGGGQTETPPAPMPPVAPTVTPQPQPAPSAPMSTGPVEGGAIAPAANAQAPFSQPTPGVAPSAAPAPVAPQTPQAAPVAPSAPTNPAGPTPAERDQIVQWLNSGDPGLVSQAESLAAEIQARAIAPAWTRSDYQAQNGVGGQYDPATNTFTPQVGGVPEAARNRTILAPEGNEFGVPAGTLLQVSPNNVISVANRPQEGYESDGAGGYRPIRGGKEDLGGNPTARFNALQSVRAEIKPVLDQAVSLNRNIQAVRSGIRAANGSGDNAIINGLQRLTDDGVVREGDVALQLRMQGIQGGIAGLMGYLRSDGTFSPEIRQQLGKLAEDIYANQSPLFREQVMGRRDLVERTFGPGSFDDIIAPSARQAYGWETAPTASQSAPRPRTAAPARPATSDNQSSDPLGLR